ncbi:MAG: glycosyltransferase family 39 protein [wastewater metagenome]|nr:glycosyltransferase family 39 protein [Candidatus Loosdrechtia aerotolerans]
MFEEKIQYGHITTEVQEVFIRKYRTHKKHGETTFLYMNSTTTDNTTRSAAVFILLFTAFLFFFNLGKRDLWAPDEPRYAQVSKEMLDSGNFIVPHLNSETYPDKPPLLFWLINLFSLPFGKVTALSSRLPSAFAGIGCCLAIFYLGKSVCGSTRIGLLSALILATSTKFLWMAHRVAFDVVLTFFVMMAILCFYKGYTGRHGSSLTTSPYEGGDKREVKKHSGWYYILFYVFMALGVLTKGPVGFILPFFTVLVYLIVKKDMRVLKETRPWIGGPIFIFVVFSWVSLAGIYGGEEYTNQILFRQNVGRFASSFAHKRPFYYYFFHFPANFLPWSIFIPGIAIYLFSQKGREKIQNIVIPLVWFAVIFIFFSIVSGKRDIYVLPLYPAAALIIAWFLNEFVEQFRERPFKKIGYYPCYLLCGFCLFLGILLPIGIYLFEYASQYVSLPSVIPFVVILLPGGFLMLRFLNHDRIIPFLFTFIFIILIVFNIGTLNLIPVLNEHKSAKEICNKANAIMKSGDKLAMYGFFRSPYLFYTNRSSLEVIYELDELRQFLESNERVFLFIREKHFKEVSKSLEAPFYVLESDSVGHRDMLFVSNKDI